MADEEEDDASRGKLALFLRLAIFRNELLHQGLYWVKTKEILARVAQNYE